MLMSNFRTNALEVVQMAREYLFATFASRLSSILLERYFYAYLLIASWTF